ncbi:hypothetical protein niasHT_002932 [Heterodera trifolii]|uniref:Uncharacterized protein n=1 Tax=Heterodera trifolii TaxID=157864 RepID=A0ABD2LP01_9BILA
MARQECELRNNGNRNVCKEEKNKHEGNYIKKYGNYRCEKCQYGKENEDNGNANYPVYQSKDIVFSDMEIPLGVPPSGSGRSTEPGIGHHFVMVFVTVALVGTAIRHGILL